MNALGKVCVTAICAGMMTTSALAEMPSSESKPCERPEFHQFDFWKGNWNLRWRAGKGIPAGAGTSRVSTILDGCVLQETFSFPTGDLQGISLSTFNTTHSKWQQTWVDNHGSYMDLAGNFRDGRMILETEENPERGSPVSRRMVWKNIAKDSLDWSLEASSDHGQTWQVLWEIHYTRRLSVPGRK